MKKILILFPLVGATIYFSLTSSASGPGLTVGAGDRTGATGPPGCGGTGCHKAVPSNEIIASLQLYDATGTTVMTSYTPGTLYLVRLTGINVGSTALNWFGFQLTAVKNGSPYVSLGTFTATTTTHVGIYGGINIVEHSSTLASTSGSYSIDIPWTAPPGGTGTIDFFAVLNAVDGSGSADANDKWNIAPKMTIPEAAGPIMGNLTICATASCNLSNVVAGGTWSSSITTVATIGSSSGIMTGISPGTSLISYKTATSAVTATATIITTPTTAAVAGADAVCVGAQTTLSDMTAGGIWTSSSTAIASIGSSSGIVTGVSLGTTTISYTVTNACGVAVATKTITTKPLGGICTSETNITSGISGTSLQLFPNPCTGDFIINVVSGENTPVHVVLTNLIGSVVCEFNIATNKDVPIHLYRPVGIYFLSARTPTGIYTSKIMIQ